MNFDNQLSVSNTTTIEVSKDAKLFKEYKYNHLDFVILEKSKPPVAADETYIYRGIVKGVDMDHITFIYISQEGCIRAAIFKKSGTSEIRDGNLIVPGSITDLSIIIDIAKTLSCDITDVELCIVASYKDCYTPYDMTKVIYTLDKEKSTLISVHDLATKSTTPLAPAVFTSIVHCIYKFATNMNKEQLNVASFALKSTQAEAEKTMNILVQTHSVTEKLLAQATSELISVRAELAAEKQKWSEVTKKLTATIKLSDIQTE